MVTGSEADTLELENLPNLVSDSVLNDDELELELEQFPVPFDLAPHTHVGVWPVEGRHHLAVQRLNDNLAIHPLNFMHDMVAIVNATFAEMRLRGVMPGDACACTTMRAWYGLHLTVT